MNKSTVDAIFVLEYSNHQGSHHWSNLPDELWWKLIQHLDVLGIDGIGFQNVTSVQDLAACPVLEPVARFLCDARYEPYHGDSKAEIAVFELNEPIRRILLAEHFDQWNRANDSFPFDELCFFKKHEIRIQAVPYENMIFFYGLSPADIRRLVEVDMRFKRGLYSRDMQRLGQTI